MAQRAYTLPQSDGPGPRKGTMVPLNMINTTSSQSPAIYVGPNPPSHEGTVSIAFSEYPRARPTTDIVKQTYPTPKAPQCAIVTTTSISQIRSSTHTPPSCPSSPTISRQNSIPAYQTPYMKMLLGLDKISSLDNILIAFFNWIILAGFLIFPATYVSLSAASRSETIASNATARKALTAIQHVPLLVMAYICCGVGCLGIFWLWWKLRMNYVWLCNKIFFTVCLNSLAGLVSTLISVYGQKDGNWGLQAIITAAVTGGVFLVTGILYLIYNFIFLSRVKANHDREMAKLECLMV